MLFVIVPVFNRSEQTRRFLASVEKQTFREIFVVLINDGSTDDSSEVIASYSPRVQLVELKTNDLWWGGSINYGLEWLRGSGKLREDDFIALANNDTIFDEHFVEKSIQTLIKYDEVPVLLHPQVRSADGSFHSAGNRIVSWFPYITVHPKNIQPEFIQIDLGTARFLLGRSAVFERLGGISRSLPQYQGDNDLTLRAKKMGIRTVIARDLTVVLDDSETGKKAYNIYSFKELLRSFTDIRSPNNVRFRYLFLRNHFGRAVSVIISGNLMLNSVMKLLIKKIWR